MEQAGDEDAGDDGQVPAGLEHDGDGDPDSLLDRIESQGLELVEIRQLPAAAEPPTVKPSHTMRAYGSMAWTATKGHRTVWWLMQDLTSRWLGKRSRTRYW